MTGTIFDVDVIASSGSAALTFVDGVTIHRRGDEGCCAYIVKRGSVELRQRGRPVERIGPGEIFGEASVITGAPQLDTAVAIDDVELLPIDRGLFDVLLRDDEDFAQTVMRLLARRLRATAEMFERCVDDLPAEGVVAVPTRATA
jgi:CRP-like cAMP-binding protein